MAIRCRASIEAAGSPIEGQAWRGWRRQRPLIQARDGSSRGRRDALARLGIRGVPFRMHRQERTHHVHRHRDPRE
jgi:hypothetical protein